jgi:hypothetical protein
MAIVGSLKSAIDAHGSITKDIVLVTFRERYQLKIKYEIA